MSALSKILRLAEDNTLMFWCPGCDGVHGIRVGQEDGSRPRWGYNGNPEKPTFTPSILVRSRTWVPPVTPKNFAEYEKNPWPQHAADTVCHSFVTDGRIQFLADCTHALAGQTVDIPPFDQEEIT